jgi:phosphate transport system substrate-binding protein
MKLTPVAKLFIAAVILAVIGFTGWHYYKKEESKHDPQASSGSGGGVVGGGVAAAPSGATAAGSDQGARLRLTGSNTIGSSLAPMLARAWLQQQGATSVGVDDSRRGEERVTVRGTLRGAPISIEIYSPGSAVAFDCLKKGFCDVGMASRAIKEDEVRALSSLGDMTDASNEHVLALDGIAVIVNKRNPTSQLALADVAKLFSGGAQDWSALGGHGPVHVFSRDEKSGTYDAFLSMVLHGQRMRADAKSFDDSSALANAVAADVGGVGFVGLSLVGPAKAVAVREGDGEPLYPTVFTVATEDYPLSRRLRLYTPATPTPLARSFVEFALSLDGQRVVEEAGFVALTVRRERPTVPGTAPSAYKRETHEADRLSLSFRFRTGSATLDTRGSQDIDRVISFLSQPAERGRHVALFGFADNQGGDKVNVELSQKRAQVVAHELGSRGITPERVVGFGSVMPLAANDTPEGRERNRRVEIWVR